MSTVLESLRGAAEEPERGATAHTAVLDPDRRKDTGLRSGLIAEKDALYMADYVGTIFHGIPALASLRLGDEVPFYEVALHGKVYRALARPVPAHGPQDRGRDVKYELARSYAEGLRQDGWLLEPPTAIPNTLRALVRELQDVTGLTVKDIVDNAFSILNYRRHHGAQYPNSMEPKGYGFRELFLMSVDGDGSLKTLYETPSGVNPEKWTNFLRVLDRKESVSLRQYAVSGMVRREYGDAGTEAMRNALRMRDGVLHQYPPMPSIPFLELFPLSDYSKLERTVGGEQR
ncbi:hypothetical protein E9536_40755 [Burkholderia sp. LS-044]|uniref:hypothetical protein n=1 Tax=Burkholderia sp. LS-044 TaxID=1459967 RepID=UPI0010A5AE53|nr:hypothetical protein [Burkholderia sp. LS-044]THJ45675.1 hypothetical protein E9536_40755 [Burkholderia sp. LS-044]